MRGGGGGGLGLDALAVGGGEGLEEAPQEGCFAFALALDLNEVECLEALFQDFAGRAAAGFGRVGADVDVDLELFSEM